MSAPRQYYPQPARDDLAFKMFAAWINCEPDKVPAQFRAWTCPQSRQAWERVAAAARADLAPAAPKVKALVEAAKEVGRISDRDHVAWRRLAEALAALE